MWKDSLHLRTAMEDVTSMEAAGTPATGGGYEFSPEDDDLFKGLSNRMRYLAVLLVILALLGIPAILGGGGYTALVTLLYTVTGVLTFGVARSLRRIVTTEGSDISHLMSALGSLNNLLTFVVILVTILLTVGAGGILAALFIAVFL